jgi:Restriction endonuclease
MFTPTTSITDWRDLQEKTCRLFSEMGYNAEVSKQVPLAGRGEKEIDVYVQDPNASYNKVYLIECKLWEGRVAQETVHAFKTVMEETGANTGFIVSKAGFQSGAHAAARFTNIRLLTFEELQHIYGEEWLRKQRQKLQAQVDRLRQIYNLYFDQFSLAGIHNNKIFKSPEQRQQLAYFNHWVLKLIAQSASRWPESYIGPEPVKAAINPVDPYADVQGWFEFSTVREYFVTMIAATAKCADEFDAFQKAAQTEFNSLSDLDHQSTHNTILLEMREEMPIRVLKQYIKPDEYSRLLDILKTDKST